ncbi:AraC family transcriptional regulator [Clostridium estertheticum]|uniref:AraC family transcriptional regulator n=1 Tax=Clostridium estertheticum TaxID=238834 RepID=UPI0013E99BDF|nr:AraC family transcriptional regulator [Clostridium estertheticum]MBZ9686304.1 AraC family transcriptional regulator [Clostridium estertheticum]
MNLYQRIEKSMDFIEENLTTDISLTEIANEAYCSLSYFHQLFHALVGYSLKEYVRKRRLAESAYELISTQNKILDIALKYGYETPESFTRAFSKMYGLIPSKYRKNSEHKIFFKKRDLNEIKYKNIGGDFIIEPIIIEKDEFKVIGIEVKTSFEDIHFPELIHSLWDRYFRDRIEDAIPNKISSNSILGMDTDYDGEGSFSYIVCKEVSSLENIPEGMVGKVVPSSKYAIFTARGIDKSELGRKLGEIWHYFFESWLPNSCYSQPGLCPPSANSPYNEAAAANFELYDERFKNDGFEVDVYIPIKE